MIDKCTDIMQKLSDIDVETCSEVSTDETDATE
jgi:hypothetical protein